MPAANPLPFEDTRTCDNLKASFASDAQSQRMAEYFARVAEIEGLPGIARTFREICESQAVEADGHLDFLMRASDPLVGAPLGETAENARAALAAAARDAEETLPHMAKTACAEGFPDVASWFETLARARRAHAERLRRAVDSAAKGG